jgi:hypothetical protein
MRTLGRRLALALSALIAGAAIAVAVASPAQATVANCVNYLVGRGYDSSSAMKAACVKGANGTDKGDAQCRSGLKAVGVTASHASRACSLA